MIDANGNIIETVSGTNDPDGKIAKENAERKAKENREKEEKVKEKRARIAYLSGETSAVTSERVTSYQNVMLEHGLDIPPEYLYITAI